VGLEGTANEETQRSRQVQRMSIESCQVSRRSSCRDSRRGQAAGAAHVNPLQKKTELFSDRAHYPSGNSECSAACSGHQELSGRGGILCHGPERGLTLGDADGVDHLVGREHGLDRDLSGATHVTTRTGKSWFMMWVPRGQRARRDQRPLQFPRASPRTSPLPECPNAQAVCVSAAVLKNLRRWISTCCSKSL
jgi:hypothetical protein